MGAQSVLLPLLPSLGEDIKPLESVFHCGWPGSETGLGRNDFVKMEVAL